MSRELDFIDFIDELAESEGRARSEVKPMSNRQLLANAIANIDEYPNEKDILLKYKNAILKLVQVSGTAQAENIENELRELEEKLQSVIAIEKRKAFSEAAAKAKEETERLKALYNQHKECNENQERPQVNPTVQVNTKAEKEKNSKAKSILTSIPLSVIGLLEFYLIYGIAFLIIALLFWLISYIPILSTLVDWLFRIREDTPDMFAMFASTGIAYLGFTVTIEHISKKVETKKLTLMFVGIYLIVLNVLFLIINLKYNDPILANILLTIAGIVIFFKGKCI